MSNYQSDQIKLINTSLIDPHPDNPRKQIGRRDRPRGQHQSQRPGSRRSPSYPTASAIVSSPAIVVSPHASRPATGAVRVSCLT